jgi:hypothetical protein
MKSFSASTFYKILKKNDILLEKCSKLGFPTFFDNSLTSPFIQNKIFTLQNNLNLFSQIGFQVGTNISFIKDTYSLLKINKINSPKIYAKTNCTNDLQTLINNDLLQGIILNTCTTNNFQNFYNNKSINENEEIIKKIVYELDLHCYQRERITVPYPKIKLNIQCIHKCPFEDKVGLDNVSDKVANLFHYVKPDILSFVDTTGSMNQDYFDKLILKCVKNEIPLNRVAIYLKYLPENEKELNKIIISALNAGINKFDVATTSDLYNITYNYVYKVILDEIIKK